MSTYIGAIDQGTTSTRFIVFDRSGRIVASAQKEHEQIYPMPGWVEHDAEEIWRRTLQVIEQAMSERALRAKDFAAIGITNQRETTVLWDRKTGIPVANALVWQDTRTEQYLTQLAGSGDSVRRMTGLPLSTYFSSLKIRWLLDNVPGLDRRARAGEIAFGTIDSFLLWRLSGGRRHATDVTNAARTMLFDIERLTWDAELLDAFGIPRALLPEVLDTGADYGATAPGVLGPAIPIAGIAGDQQAAAQHYHQAGARQAPRGRGHLHRRRTPAPAHLDAVPQVPRRPREGGGRRARTTVRADHRAPLPLA